MFELSKEQLLKNWSVIICLILQATTYIRIVFLIHRLWDAACESYCMKNSIEIFSRYETVTKNWIIRRFYLKCNLFGDIFHVYRFCNISVFN